MQILKTLIPFFGIVACMALQPALSSAGGLSGVSLMGGGLNSLIMQLVVIAIAAGVIRFFAAGTIVARIALPALGIVAVLILLRYFMAAV